MYFLILVPTALFGLIIGSFLNCVAWRLHENSTILGRSYCRACHALIRWFDNVPLLSFLALRGRCRNCRSSISWQYPAVEAVTALLFALAAWHISLGFGPMENWEWPAYVYLLRNLIFISALILTFLTDIRHYEIYDIAVLPAVVLVVALNLILGESWLGMLISGTIGGGFFLLQYIISRGRWIGSGDSRLGLLLGLGLGWPLVLPAIFIAYLIGAVTGVGLLTAGKKEWGSKLPLGTFLAVAGIITLFYGQSLLDWYLRFTHL